MTSTVDASNNAVKSIIDLIKKNDNSALKKYFKGSKIKSIIINNEIILKSLIKTGNNEIIKFFFKNFIYDNNFILNLLILYKNKKLTYSILKHLLEEENSKIVITDELYKKTKLYWIKIFI